MLLYKVSALLLRSSSPLRTAKKDNRKVILFFVFVRYVGVERRYYFVVVCQLTGASVSKLPRAPQLSHRKSDGRLSTLRQHHYLSAYGTAHKIGVEPILSRFIARPSVCASL